LNNSAMADRISLEDVSSVFELSSIDVNPCLVSANYTWKAENEFFENNGFPARSLL
jgi:hypothetical protein